MPRGEDRQDGVSADAAHAPTASSGASAAAAELAEPERELSAGDRIGDYVVDAKIGEGGFGTVFKATHAVIGSVAAIKVLKRKYSAEPTVVSRFIAEARAVNEIRHKNIINVFAFGKLADGRQYYAMEYLDGVTLDELRRSRETLSFADAVPILRKVAQALDAAHAAGVIHRDLKPANVLVAGDEVRLLDFGVAKLATIDTAHDTATGTPIGTPRYMSPEQARGRAVDHRSDIYSFGVLIYEMLAGATPFSGDDFMDVVLKQIYDDPPPPSSVRDGVSPAFDDAVLTILSKDPDERPGTALEALERVERAGDAPARRPSGRGWAVVAALAAGLVVAGGVFALTRSGSPGATAADAAPQPVAVAEEPAAPPIDAAPAPPPTVVVEIRDLQPDARVLDADGAVLRVGPGPVELPRGADPVEIHFEADGYEPQTRSVEPTAPTILVLELERERRRKPKPKPKKRVEPDKDDIVETF